MAPGRPRDKQKERQWQRWIDKWRASGLSVRAFCDRHRLPTATFYAWRRRLQRRAAATASFLPVQVVADPPPPQASPLEVVLADGALLRVASGFDPTTLRQLLAVLREGGAC
jgi:hypothetical protein